MEQNLHLIITQRTGSQLFQAAYRALLKKNNVKLSGTEIYEVAADIWNCLKMREVLIWEREGVKDGERYRKILADRGITDDMVREAKLKVKMEKAERLREKKRAKKLIEETKKAMEVIKAMEGI